MGLVPKWPQRPELGQSESKALGPSSTVFSATLTGSEVEQLELEVVPIYNASITGGGLTYHGTALAPYFIPSVAPCNIAILEAGHFFYLVIWGSVNEFTQKHLNAPLHLTLIH